MGASLPARSPASRSLAEGRRFGVGRWVVKIVLNVNYFLLLVISQTGKPRGKPDGWLMG